MKITLYKINDVFNSPKKSIDTLKLQGYELVKEFFVDNSGWGSESEPALTINRFINELSELLKDYPQGLYSFITDCGQFQIYIGCFIKTKNKTSKKIAYNTIEYINQENQKTIRFHDTDILIFNKINNTVKVFNNGYYTLTTKERINRFLPAYQLYQRHHEWYFTKGQFNPKEDIKFYEGIELSLN